MIMTGVAVAALFTPVRLRPIHLWLCVAGLPSYQLDTYRNKEAAYERRFMIQHVAALLDHV